MEGKKKKSRGLLIAKPNYNKAYITLRNPLSISPDLYPIRIIEEEKNMNKQPKSNMVDADEKKSHWLDGSRPEKDSTGKRRRGGRGGSEGLAKFPWCSMRASR